MTKVVAVSLKKGGKNYYFSCDNISDITINVPVIVETEKGLQYGIVVSSIKNISDSDMGLPTKNIVRLATNDDVKTNSKNIADAKKALIEARKIADKLKLDMRIIDASFTFDRKQLLFNFLADDRVDFRDLAKKLAQIYKTRIELRQIGVRDKAREIGGIGPCGRFLCCSSFLTDFNSVSINMAKNQLLSLNPTKINGVCGRLLCCLNYEDDVYTDIKNKMPHVGERYKNDDVRGKISSINILKGSIIVETDNHNFIEVEEDIWKL